MPKVTILESIRKFFWKTNQERLEEIRQTIEEAGVREVFIAYNYVEKHRKKIGSEYYDHCHRLIMDRAKFHRDNLEEMDSKGALTDDFDFGQLLALQLILKN